MTEQKNDKLETGTHWRAHGTNFMLEYIIHGLDIARGDYMAFDRQMGGSIICEYDTDCLYGTYLCVLQNYITGCVADLFIASKYYSKKKEYTAKDLIGHGVKLYGKGKLISEKYTNIELIIALANAYKHRDNYYVLIDRIENGVIKDEAECKFYHTNTLSILTHFNLIKNETEINTFPIQKGFDLLSENWDLMTIYSGVCDWRKKCWEEIEF